MRLSLSIINDSWRADERRLVATSRASLTPMTGRSPS